MRCIIVIYLIGFIQYAAGENCVPDHIKFSTTGQNFLEEGDGCDLPNGKCGKCISYDNYLKSENVDPNFRPDICGFKKNSPLVCVDLKKKLSSKEKIQKICESLFEIYNPRLEPSHAFGGVNALPATFPHMAVLGYNGENNETIWGCGGSLISDKFVLTASHCLFHKTFGNITKVRLGELNLKQVTDPAKPQDFKILRAIRHPNYTFPSKYNDIALLELERPVVRNFFVKPACLETEKIDYPRLLFATGWGLLQYEGEPADHLQLVYLEQSKYQSCSNHYKPEKKLINGIDDNTMICAGSETADTCQGDSGGPLQVPNNDRKGFKIIGITSFGKACGISKSPSVYTRVSHYIDWIVGIVWPEDFS